MEPSQVEEHTRNNAAALAWLDAWYATPDTMPEGYWEALLHEIEIDRLRFCDEEDVSC